MNTQILILAIFLVTYAVIAAQALPGLRVDRTSGVLIGGTLLVLTGLISLREAYGLIDGDVILFLLGMMIMVAGLEHAGFFETVALAMIRASRTSTQLLAWTIVTSGVLSALFVNDTVCLLVPPVMLRVARHLKRDPVPYLIAIATASNIGSALTVTGNPQNMFIGIQSGISFLRFSWVMAVPVVLGLLANFVLIRVLYAREVNGAPLPTVPAGGVFLRGGEAGKALMALVATVVMFILGVSYPLAALVGASALLLIGRVNPREIFQEVDWTLLLFFAGLFIVTGAFEKAGFARIMIEWAAPRLGADDLSGMTKFTLLTALMSNVVSNVPAVILMRPFVESLGGGDRLWVLLAMASTFAGNLTLVGSVANLIVAGKAAGEGVHLSFWAYFIVGFPLTVLTLAFGTLWLYGM